MEPVSINQEIANWDGKSSSDIGAIFARRCDDKGFVSQLIASAQNADLQPGATWLLKRHLEDGRRLRKSEVAKLFKLLPQLEHWESKLHVLQSIPYLSISKTDKKRVEKFLRECLLHTNKFVRAWAYNGFYEISLQYPEYEEEAKTFFEMAMRDEAPSVKARIRNIAKDSAFWD